MTVRLAILTVVRNDLAGLIATHGSLREQTSQRFDWIVVDGASTDGTAEWLAEHARETAWCRSAPDGGIYDAMNIALEAALEGTAASHLLFLNAGDRLAGPFVLDHLERLAGCERDADLIYGHAHERMPDGRVMVKRARSHRWAALGMFTHHQAMLYRRGAVADLRFDSRFAVAADYAFTLGVLSRGGRAVLSPCCLCEFAPNGRSQRQPDLGRREQCTIRSELLGYGILGNATLFGLQCLTLTIRRHVPRLYEKFRFRPSDTSCLL
ncbi:glycosyltransferase [Azospirillum rugosum]|uniref:Colanic acid biosynthesis glycosyltransferase n=1 Tax=Azospirillum rugosum TaxID=416170 RepID=A0ABS4SVX1_9PROT|nr:glycosyltransferase [Azospirillum rugosum]MBP2296724.1 putative colanic acid biosynthesis glycosyltransferase [Azospirillum rugosum]MDQ0530463.1 putative colanic acid biosynthesis glycosyltransferase [Azospirillum rugosum]